MRGHEAITNLRMRGYKPTNVWLVLLDIARPEFKASDPETFLANGFNAEVQIDPGENISTLDLRFLTGLTVHLVGSDIEKIRRAYSRLKTFGPARVISSNGDFFHDTGEQ